MDAVAHRQREGRIVGLHALRKLGQRRIEVQKLPAVLPGRGALEVDHALQHGVLAAQGRILLDLRGLVVGGAAQQHDAHAVEALQALLHPAVVLVALAVAPFAELPGTGLVVLGIARVVHAEGHVEHRRTLREDVAVEPPVHVARRLTADAGVHHLHVHVGEAGHVVEPDVGVIVSSVGDAVAEEDHPVAVAEGRDGLRLRTRRKDAGKRCTENQFFHKPYCFRLSLSDHRRAAHSAPASRTATPTRESAQP